jgi:WD40 repeat protein
VTIRDAASGAEIRSLSTDSEFSELRLSTDGKFLVGVFRTTNTVTIWDVTTGEAVQKIAEAGPVFIGMAFTYNPDGKRLAFCAGDLDNLPVKVFDTTTGKLLYRLDEDKHGVDSLMFSPDDKFIATGSSGGKVKLWDAATGKLLRTMEGHTQLARSVAFSPDGKFLVSGGGNNEAKIWSVSTGKLLVTLKTFNDGNWVAFTPDGFYNRSEGATKYITWRVGNKLLGESEYKAQFFKPEEITRRLRD